MVRQKDKALAWMAGELKTPPMSSEARVEAGMLLRRLQRGETLTTPDDVIKKCKRRLAGFRVEDEL